MVSTDKSHTLTPHREKLEKVEMLIYVGIVLVNLPKYIGKRMTTHCTEERERWKEMNADFTSPL